MPSHWPHVSAYSRIRHVSIGSAGRKVVACLAKGLPAAVEAGGAPFGLIMTFHSKKKPSFM
jgi:hypothetical protein